MLDTISWKDNEPTVAPSAWLARFQDHATTRDLRTIRVKEPNNVVVTLEPIDAPGAMNWTLSADPGALVVMWIPQDVKAPELERQAEDWLQRSGSNTPPVRAGIRTVRVHVGEDRALIYASAENLDPSLDAVIRFAVALRELTALEKSMAQMWTEIDDDAPVAQLDARRRAAQQKHIDEMVVATTRMKASFLRLDPGAQSIGRRARRLVEAHLRRTRRRRATRGPRRGPRTAHPVSRSRTTRSPIPGSSRPSWRLASGARRSKAMSSKRPSCCC